jgi:CheY-like chemotaxis protein
MNLAINARDAMPDGGTIRISARNATASAGGPLGLAAGDYVVLSVEDGGSGIPKDILERVTEPFFTTKEVGKGTGLGLSMVYGFASQSGGALDISSKEGRGTTVTLWLPRAPTHEQQIEDTGAGSASPTPAREGLRILLVDDNEAVRATTEALLVDLGHTVDAAEDGPSMLRLLSEGRRFDLIVTDYAMPLMSGGEAMLQATRVDPKVRAIIISGYADAEAIEKKPPGVQILGKPFSQQEMVRAIESAMAG